MSIDSADLRSKRARLSPAGYFPDPPIPVRFAFEQGTPSPESYPVEDLVQSAHDALEKYGTLLCEYVDTGRREMRYGNLALRQAVASRLGARDGRPLSAEEVMLTNGSSQALSLIANAFVDEGDGVVVEALTFPFAIDYFRACGGEIARAELDDDGIVVESVAKALDDFDRRGITPKLIYTIPTFQVPTGRVLPLERRRQLLALAKERGVLVVEDNCYYELRYSGEDVPTLFSLDDADIVLQTDSFSKIVSPGLRMGWVAGPTHALDALGVVRQDLGVSQWNAHVLELFITSGRLDAHVARLRAHNREKRDLAAAALREHCAGLVRFRVPEGGIFFWLELSEDTDCEALREECLRRGLSTRPGEVFSDDSDAQRYLRMAFLPPSKKDLAEGIQAFGEALRATQHVRDGAA